MMNDNMISIIIPVYNAETYLEECLTSIKNQTFKDLEVLLVDDGSSDNSKGIIDKFMDKDNRFKYFYQKNSGVSAARNLGIDKAQGKYITFVDADDWLDATMYDTILSKMEANQSQMALCSYVREYPHLNKSEKEDLPFKNKSLFLNEEVQSIVLYEMLGKKALRNTSIMGSVWRLVFSREFVLNNTLQFDRSIKVGEDLLFSISALKKCTNLTVVDEPFYHYRFTPGSAMLKYRPNQWEIGHGFNKKFREAVQGLPMDDINELIAFDLIRAALGSSESVCKPENKNNATAKLKQIKEICKTPDLVTYMKYIDFSKVSSKDKLKINFLKYKFPIGLYSFYTLKSKKSST
ncbi:glycosyltransferase [Romboutsia sp.]|uniref:glycosyltransferase n=1 Tax=Romboutsia sp. TaxID=1965302 RepID=UPI003F400735